MTRIPRRVIPIFLLNSDANSADNFGRDLTPCYAAVLGFVPYYVRPRPLLMYYTAI